MDVTVFKKSPILLYGSIVIALILWYMAIFAPLRQHAKEMELRIEAAELEQRRLKKELIQLSKMGNTIELKKRRLESLKTKQLPGSTPQEVSTKLQDLLVKKASDHGLNVITYRAGGIRTWKEYKVANVRMTVNADTETLVAFLQDVEKDSRLLRFKAINIAKIMGRKPVLRATIEVEALILK